MRMHLSVNQLAEFNFASEASKKRIIRQQQVPDRLRIQWYQLCKSRIKKSFEQNGNLDPVIDGINVLVKKTPTNKRQLSDRQVSIEALQRFIEIKLPSLLYKIDYETIKPMQKSIMINGLEVLVAPEVVIKATVEGKTVIGGIKIHVSKGKPFSFQQSQIISTLIFRYLTEKVAGEEDIVLPELCLSLDVFAQRIVSASESPEEKYMEIEEICNEVENTWKVA